MPSVATLLGLISNDSAQRWGRSSANWSQVNLKTLNESIFKPDMCLTGIFDNPFLGRSKKLNLLLALQVIVYFIDDIQRKE